VQEVQDRVRDSVRNSGGPQAAGLQVEVAVYQTDEELGDRIEHNGHGDLTPGLDFAQLVVFQHPWQVPDPEHKGREHIGPPKTELQTRQPTHHPAEQSLLHQGVDDVANQ